MNALVALIRRFFRLHGEGLLNAATKDLDKVAEALQKASAQLGAEFTRESEAIQAARIAHSAREYASRQALAALSANQDRTQRVAAKIADLVA